MKKAKRAPQQKQTSRGTAARGTLEPRQRAFVAEYLKDLNGTQAAIRAGYSPGNARVQASELLAIPKVAAEVETAMQARAARTEVDADKVIRRLDAIATADPTELMEIQRVCCRYCYGKGHMLQRTPREMRDAKAQHERDQLKRQKKGQEPSTFDEAGGIGYDPRKAPHPDCPECCGEGEQRVVLKDIRDVSPQARMLFAGVKQTQHGIEIKVHNQIDALTKVGEHLGVFKQRVEVTGANGVPLIADILDEINGAGTGKGPG